MIAFSVDLVPEELRDSLCRWVNAQIDAETEACARVAELRAEHNADCPAGCRCGDGWHIAAAIRARKQ